MNRWDDKIALVTGGSSGIGCAVAYMLAKCGMKVVVCARRKDKLDEMAKNAEGTIIPYQCDLTKKEEVEQMFEKIESEHGGVDVCVANAGLAKNKSLLDASYEDWKSMVDLNILSLCQVTQLSIKSMLKRQVSDGQIIMINSLSGHRVAMGSPTSRFYAATKYAVTALTEGFRQELNELKDGKSLRICSLSPGLVKSEFISAMNGGDEAKAEELYAKKPYLECEDLAASVKYVLEAPRHVQIHEIMMRNTNTYA